MPRQRRSFSADFKARAVLDVLTGAFSAAEVCRRHQIKPNLLALWKATLLERLPPLFEGDGHNANDQSQTRIAELEQLVGRQAYELEILKKASRLLSGPASRNGRS